MENSDEKNGMKSLSREDLYKFVWSEPMLKIAVRYGVSSSYMARMCSHLNVPRPGRGYWAKLEVGIASEKIPLPAAEPGNKISWRKGGGYDLAPKPPMILSVEPTERSLKHFRARSSRHPLVKGVKQIIEAGRVSIWDEYLKPSKRLLVYVIATKNSLAKALSFANRLFNQFESQGHQVTICSP